MKYRTGVILSFVITLISYLLGTKFPVIGGPIFAILLGMLLSSAAMKRPQLKPGLTFVSKKVLQLAVILLGFGLNLQVILKTGLQSLPIILSTILTSLIIAYVFFRKSTIESNSAILIGVGSSICGGSAIAATAPVIGADDQEIAESISVIFLFNVLAALIFPSLGALLGFNTASGEAFGIFVGTAVNDSSSVTAAASTWDTLYGLGSATLDKAVTVKLTRTLAIIPIVFSLAFYRAKKQGGGEKLNLKKSLPTFILYFLLASVITTVSTAFGLSPSVFTPFKELSKFFIIMAMAAIGLGTNFKKLIASGVKPLLLGASCWAGITMMSLVMQKLLNIW